MRAATVVSLLLLYLAASAWAASIQGSRCYKNNEYCFSWSVPSSEKGKANLTLTVRTQGWMGVGISPSPSFMGLAAIMTGYVQNNLGFLNCTHVAENKNTRPTILDGNPFDLEIIPEETFSNSTHSQVSFSRPLSAYGANNRAIVNQMQHWIFAWSPDNSKTLNFHSKNAFGDNINLFKPNQKHQPISTVSALKITHGVFMAFAWAVCATLGIMIARFTKNELGVWWFRLHLLLGALATTSTIIGFIIIAVEAKGIRFYSPHYISGYTIVIGSLLQPLLGVLADRMFNPDRSKPPVFPDKVHWMVGRVIWILGFINIYTGLGYVNAHWWFYYMFYVWVALVVAIFGFTSPSAHHTAFNPID